MNWNRMSLFKLPSRSRGFNFHPRYYDERKERLNKMVELHSGENKKEDRVRTVNFRADIEDNWGQGLRKSQILKSNIRLLVILLIILMLFYYIFIGLDNVGELIENAKS